MSLDLLPLVHEMRVNYLEWDDPDIAEDYFPKTQHLIIYRDKQEPIGVVSYTPMTPEDSDEPSYMNSMRFFGFGVAPEVRGTGIGSLMMEQLRKKVQMESDYHLLWANARLSAVPFYKKHGFLCTGKVFTDRITGRDDLRIIRPLITDSVRSQPQLFQESFG